ncbi:MAG: hypothetical protein JW922_10550, partial [Paludibacteraceae bacterium]|nr:hypothetical protein [Paludibacteraceae bacterium]
EGHRYILEMYKADNFLNELVIGFDNYLKNRDVIVGFNSKADVERSLNFHKLNELTRPNQTTNKEEIEGAVNREHLSE